MRLSLLWTRRIAAGLVGLLHTAIAIQDQSINEYGVSYLDLSLMRPSSAARLI